MLSIDSFLAALRLATQGRIPAEILEPRLREIRSHLQSAAKEGGEIEAVRQFGDPRQLANEMIRTHRGYERKSAIKLTQSVGIALYFALVLPQVCVALPPTGEGWIRFFTLFNDVVVLAAFGGFTLCAFQTRRWLILPATSWSTCAMFSIPFWRIALTHVFPEAFPHISLRENHLKHALALVLGAAPPCAVVFFILNGLALILCTLGDRRRVRLA